MTDNLPKKSRGFQKGVSGNPAGRPKNTKNAITLARLSLEGELRKQMSFDMRAVLHKAIEMAKAGDAMMIKLLLDKSISSPRSTDDEGAGREKIQIIINKLPELKTVNAQVIDGELEI